MEVPLQIELADVMKITCKKHLFIHFTIENIFSSRRRNWRCGLGAANRISIRFFEISVGQSTPLSAELPVPAGPHWLVESNDNIKNISEECSFENIASFYFAFRRNSGMASGEYRRRQQPNI